MPPSVPPPQQQYLQYGGSGQPQPQQQQQQFPGFQFPRQPPEEAQSGFYAQVPALSARGDMSGAAWSSLPSLTCSAGIMGNCTVAPAFASACMRTATEHDGAAKSRTGYP